MSQSYSSEKYLFGLIQIFNRPGVLCLDRPDPSQKQPEPEPEPEPESRAGERRARVREEGKEKQREFWGENKKQKQRRKEEEAVTRSSRPQVALTKEEISALYRRFGTMS